MVNGGFGFDVDAGDAMRSLALAYGFDPDEVTDWHAAAHEIVQAITCETLAAARSGGPASTIKERFQAGERVFSNTILRQIGVDKACHCGIRGEDTGWSLVPHPQFPCPVHGTRRTFIEAPR